MRWEVTTKQQIRRVKAQKDNFSCFIFIVFGQLVAQKKD
jgi:hypothetical protein